MTAHSESTTLDVRQAKRPRAQVFSEDPILLPEIVDQIVLVTVHPASEREDEELQRRRHSLRLLGRLDQHRPSLGRFFAPYDLYRAIDSSGPTIDFVLSGWRDAATATRLFRKALTDPSHPQPRVLNTDQARPYGSAIAGVKKAGILRRRCRHRPVQYVNNIVEQDHRAIKRRVTAKQGFRAFHAARRRIQDYEAMHMIRKGQARWVSGLDGRRQIQFINKLFGVVA